MPIPEAVVISTQLINQENIKWIDAVDLYCFYVGKTSWMSSKNAIKRLLKRKLLIKKKISGKQAKTILEKKSSCLLPMLNEKIKICQWCQSATFILQKHHYPIQKNSGGTKTVDICPNCHSEFHYLVDYGTLEIRPEIIKYLQKAKLYLENKYAKRT